LEGETLWNSFTPDRFIEANRKLKMSPLEQLHHLLPPPPVPQGKSARAIASWRKTLAKLMVEACEANKSFLMSSIYEKEYSRTLLVDDGSIEGARSTGAFRSSPRREGHSGRSPQRDRSPRHRPARGSSSPRRDKSKARTNSSPRSSPPPRSMGPPPPWKGKFSSLEADLRSLSDSKQKLEDRVDHLYSELRKSNGELQDQYQRHDKLQDKLSVTRDRLSESKAAYDSNNQFTELKGKYKAITKLRDAELAKSALKARKEVKVCGMELIQGAILFIQTEKTRSKLESDIKEHKSNLLLLDQTPKLTSLRNKKGSSEPVDTTAPEVPATPVEIPESAPILPEAPPAVNNENVVIPDDEKDARLESGTPSEQLPAAEPTETEAAVVEPEMATDSYRRSLSSRRLCNERQHLGLKRQPLEARIARVEKKVRAMESDPFQWEWRNFDCVPGIPTMLYMYLRARGEVPSPVNAPVEVVPSGSEKDDDEEEDNNPGSVRLEGVSLSANHFILEWDCAMEFNLQCSEFMPDFLRVGMMDKDIPNVPGRGPSPPRGFFRSQIRAPCALIKGLPDRDEEIAMSFIKALAVQHQKHSLKKKKLQNKINQMLRRVTVI
ncbi:hypothetical protein ISN44_Un113g000010, partial [Arabidopsis suecica]